jgi:hypothetical protein
LLFTRPITSVPSAGHLQCHDLPKIIRNAIKGGPKGIFEAMARFPNHQQLQMELADEFTILISRLQVKN